MPVEPPPKKEQLQKLLERGNVFLHLDPRAEGVLVPAGHANKPQLVLQLGLHFAVPIPDLKIDERGVRCTLSFNRSPFLCILPWSAVYAMVAEDGQVTVWPTELPPELIPQPAPVRRAPPTSRGNRGRAADAAESASDSTDGSAGESDGAPAVDWPRPRIAAVPSTRSTRLAPVTPIKPPTPAVEETETPSDDPPPSTPGDRKGARERPAWLRVVK